MFRPVDRCRIEGEVTLDKGHDHLPPAHLNPDLQRMVPSIKRKENTLMPTMSNLIPPSSLDILFDEMVQ